MERNVLMIPLVLSSVVSLCILGYAWGRRRDSPAAGSLCAASAISALWTAAYAVDIGLQGGALKEFLVRFRLVCGMWLSAAWLGMVMRHAGYRVTPALWVLVCALPAASLLALWPGDGNFRAWFLHGCRPGPPGGAFPTLACQAGQGVRVCFAYGFAAFLISTVLILRSVRHARPLFRLQSLVLLLGISLPLAANGLVLQFGIAPWQGCSEAYMPAPFLLVATSLFLAWAVLRYRFADLTPVAWERVMESIGTGVLVADHRDRVVDMNPAAERMLGAEAARVLGRPVEALQPLAFLREPPRPEQGPGGGLRRELRLDGGVEPARVVEVSVTPLRDRRGKRLGRIAILHDVSERKEAERRLREAGADLEVRVRERAAELGRANEALRVSNESIRALSARLERIREEERTVVAREIHDELGQALTGLKMDLGWLRKHLPSVPPDLRARVESMEILADDTIRSVRRIASELRPLILDDLGLAPAVEWLVRDFEKRTGIRCELACPADAEIGGGAATGVFRILQEALTNVGRHAQARGVFVELRADRRRLALEVRDDGRGISEEEAAGQGSLGLLGMRERAALLGGRFRVSGTPGQGTAVTVEIPLSKEEGS